MSEHRDLRVSDRERQAAADRLRVAHDEGRLDLREHDERLIQAYASVTYTDLDRLFADLPETPRRSGAPAGTAALRATSPAAGRRTFAGLPLVLRILWINWVLAVAVNVTVWTLVEGDGDAYFWPAWLAVPGVVLLGASAGITAVRAHRASLEG